MTNHHHTTCRIEWADGHQPDEDADDCQECLDSPRGICRDCEADLLDSQAEEAADGRRDDHD